MYICYCTLLSLHFSNLFIHLWPKFRGISWEQVLSVVCLLFSSHIHQPSCPHGHPDADRWPEYTCGTRGRCLSVSWALSLFKRKLYLVCRWVVGATVSPKYGALSGLWPISGHFRVVGWCVLIRGAASKEALVSTKENGLGTEPRRALSTVQHLQGLWTTIWVYT